MGSQGAMALVVADRALEGSLRPSVQLQQTGLNYAIPVHQILRSIGDAGQAPKIAKA